MSEVPHDGIAGFVDAYLGNISVKAEFDSEIKGKDELLAEEWKWENNWLADSLRSHISDLGFFTTIEQKRLQLQRLPKFKDSELVVRNFGWVPDDNARFDMAQPRVRALWMNGVHTYLPEYPYHSPLIETGMFCVGGMAVEDSDRIEFKFFASGDEQDARKPKSLVKHIYDEASQGLYRTLDLLMDSEAQDTVTQKELQHLDIQIVFGLLNLERPEDSSGFRSVEQLKTLLRNRGVEFSVEQWYQVCKQGFQNIKAEMAVKPLPANQNYTAYGMQPNFNRLLRAVPTKSSPDVLQNHLRPLVAWNRSNDAADISDNFDRYLLDSRFLRELTK